MTNTRAPRRIVKITQQQYAKSIHWYKYWTQRFLHFAQTQDVFYHKHTYTFCERNYNIKKDYYPNRNTHLSSWKVKLPLYLFDLHTLDVYFCISSRERKFLPNSKLTSPLLWICGGGRKSARVHIARIIKRVTTLEVYQEELVERTTEGTVSSAFPAFQRSNLAIFRGEAPSRKIGVRAANQRCFMQAVSAQRNSSEYFASTFHTYELRS